MLQTDGAVGESSLLKSPTEFMADLNFELETFQLVAHSHSHYTTPVMLMHQKVHMVFRNTTQNEKKGIDSGFQNIKNCPDC